MIDLRTGITAAIMVALFVGVAVGGFSFHPHTTVSITTMADSVWAPDVIIEPIGERSGCQFYRLHDKNGTHYAAVGYIERRGDVAISCQITP